MKTAPRGKATGVPRPAALRPLPPFELDRSLDWLRADPFASVLVAARRLVIALFAGDRPVVVEVSGAGLDRALSVRVLGRVAKSAHQQAVHTVRWVLATDLDLSGFEERAARDRPFRPVLDRWKGLHPPRAASLADAMCTAVLRARLPVEVARRMRRDLYDAAGGVVAHEGVELLACPPLERLAALSTADLAAVVRNQRRADYLAASLSAVTALDLEELRELPLGEAAGRLRAVRGIGPWAASRVLAAGVGRTDVIPVGDPRWHRGVAGVYGTDDLEALVGHYGPDAGIWASYLAADG